MTDRDLPVAFTDASQAAVSKPIWLVAIEENTPGTYTRLTSAERNVTFPDGGDVYKAHPMEIPEIGFDFNGGQGGPIRLSEASPFVGGPDIKALIDTGINFNLVTIYRIERDETDSSTKAQQDTFFVDSVGDVSHGSVEIVLDTLIKMMDIPQVPKRTITRDIFKGLPTET